MAEATIQSPGSEASRERKAAIRSATLTWLTNSASMSEASRKRTAAATSLGDTLDSEMRDLSTAALNGIAKDAACGLLRYEIDGGPEKLFQLQPDIGALV
jgi:hypothetical protein